MVRSSTRRRQKGSWRRPRRSLWSDNALAEAKRMAGRVVQPGRKTNSMRKKQPPPKKYEKKESDCDWVGYDWYSCWHDWYGCINVPCLCIVSLPLFDACSLAFEDANKLMPTSTWSTNPSIWRRDWLRVTSLRLAKTGKMRGLRCL